MFVDTKEVAESVNRRTNNTMAKRKRTKTQTMIYKTLQRKDWATENPLKTGSELMVLRRVVPAPRMAPIVLLLNDMIINWYRNHVGHQYKWRNHEPPYKTKWWVVVYTIPLHVLTKIKATQLLIWLNSYIRAIHHNWRLVLASYFISSDFCCYLNFVGINIL